MFYYSRDRKGEHPQAHLAPYAGILQADAYDGYNQLDLAGRAPGPIREAACWSHARRPFFAMADIEENARRRAAGKKEIALSPIAIEVVRLIDALFEIERSINGKNAQERLDVRRTLSRPIVEGLQIYMRKQVAKLSRGHNLAKAFNYIAELTPWIDGAREGLIASFANGVAKDEAAVRAAIALPWSNGQTEGQITRLKLVVSTVVKFRGRKSPGAYAEGRTRQRPGFWRGRRSGVGHIRRHVVII
jgi:transposase